MLENEVNHQKELGNDSNILFQNYNKHFKCLWF